MVVWALEGRGGKEILQQDTKVTFWDDGLVHYLYSEDGFCACVHMSKHQTVL